MSKKNVIRDDLIYMKLSEEFLTFDKQSYGMNESKLKGVISESEWQNIAVEATRVIGTAYHQRKQQENISIPKFMDVIFWVMLLFSFVAFVFLIIYTKTESENEALFYIALILIILACGVVVVLMFYNYFRKLPKEEPLDYYIIEGMKQYTKELNQKYLRTAVFNYNPQRKQLECILASKLL